MKQSEIITQQLKAIEIPKQLLDKSNYNRKFKNFI